MITTEATVNGDCLLITCSGVYGVGSEGTLSGRLVHDAIKPFMDSDAEQPSEFVIDFTGVEYVWGDGPAWSVLPWAAKGVKVTYLASDRTATALRDLFSGTHLDKLINTAVVETA